ncbi:hypothetical protein D3C81_1482980 [compost metagenome]
MAARSRAAITRSAKSGASASLVGQPTRRLPCSLRKALSGRTRPDCAGSARSTRSVRHSAAERSTHGSNSASSRRAKAICAASSRATPSASARSPPRYHTHWPSAAGWVVTVMRGLVPPPRQWAYSGLSVGALTSTMCSGRSCCFGCSMPSAPSSPALPWPALSTMRRARTWRPSTTRPTSSPFSRSGSICPPASRPSPACSARRLIRLGTSSTNSARR